MSFDVVGVGQACIDFLGMVDAYPGADSKAELTESLVQGGGPAATALVAASRLGLKTSLVTRVGDDPHGADILRGLAEEGVDTASVVVEPGAASQLAFVAVERTGGTRTVFWRRGPALRPEDVRPELVRSAGILHLDALHAEASLAAARCAREAGVPILLDGGRFRETTVPLLPFVTHLAVTEGFARDLLGRDDPEAALHALSHPRAALVCITMGARGCIALHEGRVLHQEAFAVDVVDTTGCGDAFHGGLLYAVARGWEVPRSLAFAAAVAALKCRRLGGRTALPTLAEVEALIGQPRAAAP